jgi:hypothetical protein
MEPENTDSLQLHFRKSVPVAFIARLIQRQEWIYEEARQQCFNGTLWSKAEARWMLGDTERAIFESEMRKAAKASGLNCEDADHLAKNCTYVKVSAANFRITAHRVPSPGCFVEPCESRKQDAAVNKFLDEWIDDGLLCAPLPKITSAKEIAIYVLHGATKSIEGKRTLFLELAAPDSELQDYRWNCSFADLRQSYLADAREPSAARSVEDKAKPKPKKKKDKPEAENE